MHAEFQLAPYGKLYSQYSSTISPERAESDKGFYKLNPESVIGPWQNESLASDSNDS